MKLFKTMFYEAYLQKGLRVEVWHPTVLFGLKAKITNAGIGKWLAYIDKWILFPVIITLKLLQLKLQKQDCVYHICDHSNAPYIPWLPKNKTVITCHDVLAIRGAMGYKDAYCESSPTGKILQEWILNSLLKARKIAFVSRFTMKQFLELKALKHKGNISDLPLCHVIYNGFNAKFNLLTHEVSDKIFNEYGINITTPYIFHVGSALPRKNRILLVEMLNELKESWSGVICFAGQKLDAELDLLISKYGLQERIVSIEKPKHDLLVALYNRCEAFMFPSFSEGFGWPLIEAQACGVPVITSDLDPMLEVCGGAALHADPNNPAAFAAAFNLLKDKNLRESLVCNGFKNCERFGKDAIVEEYLSFYEEQ